MNATDPEITVHNIQFSQHFSDNAYVMGNAQKLILNITAHCFQWAMGSSFLK